MALVALSDLKLHLGVTGSGDDDLLNQLQAAADGFVGIHCGRDFEGGSFTEPFAGGNRLLLLRNFPVTAVTSLKVDPTRMFGSDTERDAESYVVHTDRGVIENLHGPFVSGAEKGAHPKAVVVEYATATGAVPAAVARASADLVGFWYRQTKTQTATNQLNVMEVASSTDSTRYPWGVSGGFRIPFGILEVLAPYRARAL
ncbi:MAG TPA: hypothetical protein VGJ05_04840 [Fimbriiglobus sp.]|jgi:hypothetical protein